MASPVTENNEGMDQEDLMGSSHVSKKVLHGIKWQFLTNLSAEGIYFVNGIILARILSPKEFGIYGLALVLSNFVYMFWNLGFNSSIIQKKKITDADLDTAFTICLLMGITCFFIVYFSASYMALFFMEPSVKPIARILGLTFLIYSFDRVPSAILSRDFHFKKLSVVNTYNAVAYSIIAIPLAFLGYGALSFAWGIVGGVLIMTIYRIYWGNKLFSWRPKLRIAKHSLRDLLGFGVFITLENMVNYFLGNLQRIITGRFLGPTELGFLNRAYSMSTLPLLKVHSNVSAVLLPAFSNIQEKREVMQNWLKKFNFFTYLIVTPPIFFFIFFSNDLIIGLFGKQWAPSASLLVWLSFSVLLGTPAIYATNILRAIGKPQLPFYISLGRLVPFAILMYFSAQWGIKGIVIALFIDNLLALILYLRALVRNGVFSLLDFFVSILEPIILSLVGSVITYITYHMFIYRISIPEMRLAVTAVSYALVISPYFIYRYFKESHIKYLDFNFKKSIKQIFA